MQHRYWTKSKKQRKSKEEFLVRAKYNELYKRKASPFSYEVKNQLSDRIPIRLYNLLFGTSCLIIKSHF